MGGFLSFCASSEDRNDDNSDWQCRDPVWAENIHPSLMLLSMLRSQSACASRFCRATQERIPIGCAVCLKQVYYFSMQDVVVVGDHSFIGRYHRRLLYQRIHSMNDRKMRLVLSFMCLNLTYTVNPGRSISILSLPSREDTRAIYLSTNASAL